MGLVVSEGRPGLVRASGSLQAPGWLAPVSLSQQLHSQRRTLDASTGCAEAARGRPTFVESLAMSASALLGLCWIALAAQAPKAATPVPDASPDGGASIECPLHLKGVDASKMRPFEETEKWIEFLEKPGRATWQRPDEVVRAMRLKGSETLVDVGAGSGYFTFRFAAALPKGKVVATDIDPGFVRHLHHRILAEHVANVRVVLASPEEPTIASDADVVFVCDVIHHIPQREAWLGKAFAQMKPGARFVTVEFKEGALPEGPPEGVKIAKAKLIALLERVGFKLERDQPELLPYQTFLVFKKP